MTEIVVIIDDATAAEVRRSEYRPESRLPTPSNVVVCPRPEAPTTTKRLPIRAVRELRFQVRSSFVLRSQS